MTAKTIWFILICGLLYSCGSQKADVAEADYNGLHLKLSLTTGGDNPAASQLLQDVVKRIEADSDFDLSKPNASISKLNASANSKSVAFSSDGYDFVLQIMNLGRESDGRIDLKSGYLSELWNMKRPLRQPDSVELDTLMAQLDRSGFISASKSFLIYGTHSEWNVDPFLPAWYMELADVVLSGESISGTLQIGPLHRVYGSGVTGSVDVPTPLGMPDQVRNLTILDGVVAVLPFAGLELGDMRFAAYLDNVSGSPGSTAVTAIVKSDDPLKSLGNAILLQLGGDLDKLNSMDGVSAAVVSASGEVTGNADMIKQIH